MDPKGVPPFSRETCPGRVLGSVRKRTLHLASSAQTICHDGARPRSRTSQAAHQCGPRAERKKIWDSWIVECAHRWLALSSKQRDV
ncbi:BQ5605_C006g03988 [Microbotryum silenes-dioicae]|uniref:BQ5605_C006g03988 protein n=1 Tax=Microbotryum silenes-dioicae TaxID=796604 RepID=A0A2X0MST1_9BASI|nr:BQ5605_C006g03988 [Microbotryum silenes-dioicae]